MQGRHTIQYSCQISSWQPTFSVQINTFHDDLPSLTDAKPYQENMMTTNYDKKREQHIKLPSYTKPK